MNIYFELQQYLMNSSNLVVIPNYYYQGFECDVLVVSKKLYTTEYEIKLTKSDFKADFNKQRDYYDWQSRKTINGATKHDEIKRGKRTNRFYFVIPKGLDVEIPIYAGKIIFYEKYKQINFEIVKRAKLLHKKTLSINEIEHIAGNLSWRYYNLLFAKEKGLYLNNKRIKLNEEGNTNLVVDAE